MSLANGCSGLRRLYCASELHCRGAVWLSPCAVCVWGDAAWTFGGLRASGTAVTDKPEVWALAARQILQVCRGVLLLRHFIRNDCLVLGVSKPSSWATSPKPHQPWAILSYAELFSELLWAPPTPLNDWATRGRVSSKPYSRSIPFSWEGSLLRVLKRVRCHQAFL